MWLLKNGAAQAFELVRESMHVSDADRARFAASVARPASALDMPRIMSRAGATAEIRVEGALTKTLDVFAWLFFGANTTYSDIQESLAIAANDPNIKNVLLKIDSPGGHVDGLFETFAALEAFGKPINVLASCACSAAYGIACAARGPIKAETEASEFGSVGVAASYLLSESIVDITSTNAPDKRPDLSTEEGKAVIREQLDAIHDLFVGVIASGRGVDVETVNETFGRGRVVLAKDAKKRKMINAIAVTAKRPDAQTATSAIHESPEEQSPIAPPTQAQRKTAAAVGAAPQPRKKHMDEQELKAQHPELYAAVLAKGKADGKEEGVKEGEAKERKRVLAHLKMADTTGATKVAGEAIASGASVLDEEVHAEYVSAALKKAAVAERDNDAVAAATATAGAETAGNVAQKDLGDEIVARLDAGKNKVKK